jgi:hypothetical protein
LKKKCEIIFFKVFEYNVIYISNKPTGNICEKMSFFFFQNSGKKISNKNTSFLGYANADGGHFSNSHFDPKGKKERKRKRGWIF